MKKALVLGTTVVDVADVEFPVSEPLAWVDCPDDVASYTHVYSNGSFTAAPVQDAPVDVAPQQPGVQTKMSSLQFMDRFTEQEQLAIVSATMVSAPVKLWYDRMIAATEIVLTDPRVNTGLQQLIGAGLLTQDRYDVILPAEFRSSGLNPL
jgi:hypothetical protein